VVVSRWRREHRLEIKYAAIVGVGFGLLAALIVTNALSGLSGAVDNVVLDALGWGFAGMFLVALVANLSLAIQIPYTLPILAAAIQGRTFPYLMGLGIAAGLGSAIGGLASLAIAERLFAYVPDLSQSRLYRWVDRNAQTRPNGIRLAAFAVAATPLPDDTVIVPLAMIHYGWRRIALPYVTGKLVHNVVVAALFFEFTHWFAKGIDKNIRADASIALVLAFIALACYQTEKMLATHGTRTGDQTQAT
jgi:hypothetical protein